MKKILALLMAIMMIVGCLAINVGASEATANELDLVNRNYIETVVKGELTATWNGNGVTSDPVDYGWSPYVGINDSVAVANALNADDAYLKVTVGKVGETYPMPAGLIIQSSLGASSRADVAYSAPVGTDRYAYYYPAKGVIDEYLSKDGVTDLDTPSGGWFSVAVQVGTTVSWYSADVVTLTSEEKTYIETSVETLVDENDVEVSGAVSGYKSWALDVNEMDGWQNTENGYVKLNAVSTSDATWKAGINTFSSIYNVNADFINGNDYYFNVADFFGTWTKNAGWCQIAVHGSITMDSVELVTLTEKTTGGEPTPEGLTVKSYNTGTAYTATEALISQVTRAEFWSDINEEKHEFDIAYPWNPGNEDLSTLTTSDVKYLPRYLLADNLPTTLNADDVYIKVTTSVSTIGKVTLEGAAGMAKEISAAKYVTTVGGNTVMYFSGKALIQGGLNSIDGGAMEQIWNIGILPSNDNVKIENIEIVTLDVDTPVGEVKTLGGKKYTESDLVTLNIGSGIVLTNKWQWTAFNSGNTATPPQTWLEAMNEENTYIKFTVSAGVVDQLIMQSNKGDNDQSETKFTDADIAFIATEDGKTVNYFDANKVIKAMYANGCSDGEYWYQFAVCPANPMTIYSVEVVTLEPAVKVDVKVGDIEVGEAWEDAEITAANATVDYTAPEGTATEEDAENGKDVEVTVTVEGVLAPEELDVTVDGKKLTLTAEDLDYESSEGNTVFKVTVNIGVITADNRTTGWICTGDKYHAMMIGRAIITLPHEFGTDGDCIYCHYNKDTDTLTVSNSYESTEEETEDVEAPAEENPETGLTLALVPAVVALAAVAFKKR